MSSPARSSRPTASPHTRGWTACRNCLIRRRSGFPAHAGMDLLRLRSPATPSWLPRTRGDGPPRRRRPPPRRRASPHTRGWTLGMSVYITLQGGFPAHAGMDRRGRGRARDDRRLPRTRGDGPAYLPHAPARFLASPHTRGWTHQSRRGQRRTLGFPAHAGMDLWRRRCQRSRYRLPRTRGDGPRGGGAGGARGGGGGEDTMRGLPRTRGDGPAEYRSQYVEARASPHTRGWTPGRDLAPADRTGFPAHAGMDPCCIRASASRRWLPRTRGDGPLDEHERTLRQMASPHTRGWT